MVRVAAVLALSVLACKQPTPESTLPPKATPQQCAQVADHLVGLMTKGMARDQVDMATADKIRRVIDERCVQDGWGPDAHDCFTKLQSMAEPGKQPCEEFLSIDQRENIDKAMTAVFEEPAPTGSGTP